ncbi:MAG: hypothetical protein ACOCRK_11905 [bacterium]
MRQYWEKRTDCPFCKSDNFNIWRITDSDNNTIGKECKCYGCGIELETKDKREKWDGLS